MPLLLSFKKLFPAELIIITNKLEITFADKQL